MRRRRFARRWGEGRCAGDETIVGRLIAVGVLCSVVGGEPISKRLVASDPVEFGNFGQSVSIDGDTLIVGDQRDNSGGIRIARNARAFAWAVGACVFLRRNLETVGMHMSMFVFIRGLSSGRRRTACFRPRL